MDVTYRPLTETDVEHVRWALYEAVAWDPEKELPPYEAVIDHPELARYHRDWGRPGDDGIVAEVEGLVVGVALFRLFTDDDHGHGYVDDETPELAIAVAESHRGRGIGARLLRELEVSARSAGLVRLSLSVDSENPARNLYERLGYQELSRDAGGVRMALDLSTIVQRFPPSTR